MAINARHPHERQRWSLAHEYGHFLTNRYSPELTVLHGYLRVPAHERFAEAFAARFLMPGSGLTRRFQNLRRARDGTLTPADLLQLANLYDVSVTALVLRLEALRLVAAGTWDALLERGFRVEEAKALVGLSSTPPDTELLPLRHRYLVAEAYLDGTLSEGQLARLLRVDRLAARQLVHDLSQSADVGEDGDTLELGLDFDDGRVAS